MKRRIEMTQTDRSIEELKRAGLFDKDSDYEGMIGEAVQELLTVFGKQGHSGMSASYVAMLFKKLVDGDVLSPLNSIEDAPDEWNDVSDELWQNRRCSAVFLDKNKSSKVYTIDGKVFSDDGGKTYYTSKDSSVYFDLPGYPPKKEYINLTPGPGQRGR